MNDLSRARYGAGRLLLGGVAALFLASLSVGASAGVAYQTPAYTGVASGIYKGPAPVVSGAIRTTATLNLSGRLITVPASARIAANAAQYAVPLIRASNPLLLGASVLLWLAASSIEPDGAGGYSVPSTMPAIYSDWSVLCQKDTSCALNSCIEMFGSCTLVQEQPNCFIRRSSGANVYVASCGHPVRAPASDTDWNRLAGTPLPDAAADELADSHGVPVDPPQVAPGDVATGSPFRKPDGTWAQPRARITPMPDGSVAISPYEVPVAAPDGTPQPQPDYIPEGDPVAPGTETQPDPCDLHPDRAGCVSLGEPVDQPVSKTTQALTITPESVSMPGSCPAPKQVETPFGTIALSYDPACQFATTIRPVVLALGMFMAAMIFVGGLRNG